MVVQATHIRINYLITIAQAIVTVLRLNAVTTTQVSRYPQAVGEKLNALPLSAANIAEYVNRTLNAARSRDLPHVGDVDSQDGT